MLYCDKCAESSNLPITPNKEKGECDLCKLRLGSMNVKADENDVVEHEALDICGLTVQQIKDFYPGTKLDKVYPGSQHRIVAPDRVVYFLPGKLVVAQPSTGKQVQLKY